jgi:hypothetical protein
VLFGYFCYNFGCCYCVGVVLKIVCCLVGWCLAAWRGSRGLAYHSTACYVPGLNFRVRNGSGCLPRAVAAKTNMIVSVGRILFVVVVRCCLVCTLAFARLGCLWISLWNATRWLERLMLVFSFGGLSV